MQTHPLPAQRLMEDAVPELYRRHYRSSLALWHSLVFSSWRTLTTGAPLPDMWRRLQYRHEADWLAWQHEQLSLCQLLADAGRPLAQVCGQPWAVPPPLYQSLADGLLLYGRRHLGAAARA